MHTPQPQDPLIGAMVGSYKILRCLGTGGMGAVYLAEHSVIGSRVAVKFLHAHLASNPDLVQRFYAEARSVNLIGHANIISIFDMNVLPPNRYYLIMEYIEGKALDEMISISTPMLVPQAVNILVQACDALDAAHKSKIVHRDLKPENIMLVKRGRQENFVKILDFGIAKLFSQATNKTATGVIIGTPDYMSPEQAQGTEIDGRSDIYSLGIIAYQMVTGKTPFNGMPITSMLVAHMTQVPTEPHLVNQNVPLAFSMAVMKALAKSPMGRYQTAADFARALDASVGSTPSSISSRPSLLSTLPRAIESVSSSTPIAVVAPTPAPKHPRHLTVLEAQVRSQGVGVMSVSNYKVQDLSKGGCFIVSDGALPPVFGKVTLNIPGLQPLEGEVVRHVTKEQAVAWHMSSGFGVQFNSLTSSQKMGIESLVAGKPITPDSPANQPSVVDDAQAESVLVNHRRRVNGDHYVILGLPSEAEVSDIRLRGRELLRELEHLLTRKISSQQKSQIDAAAAKIKTALDVIGIPGPRAEYDGNRFNWKGVARAIAAGLRVADLETIRDRYLAAHPASQTAAQIKLLSANALERENKFVEAKSLYESALESDPLNLDLHQRYNRVSKRVAASAH
jgi:serine/threonine protein kinase